MRKILVIFLHACYWLLYQGLFILLVVLSQHGKGLLGLSLPGYFVSVQAFTIFYPAVLGFYSFYFFVFRFVRLRKYWQALLAALGSAMAAAVVCLGILIAMHHQFAHRDVPAVQLQVAASIVILAAAHGVVGLVLKAGVSWYDESRQRLLLLEKNHQLESQLIKLQLNPHFLFNTINNIDVLIARDPEMASRYLNQLSDLMRYMLYETKDEWVPLAQELTYIEQYIALQKLRSANEDYVQYTVEGAPGNTMIAAMLFIPYIENAFKHATDKKRARAIRIRLELAGPHIRFHCCNVYQQSLPAPDLQPGIGNQLLQQRLALLYPGRHTLETSQQGGEYQVRLTLQT